MDTLSDASPEARSHLQRLCQAVRSAGADAVVTKELMTGPWILRCELPGIRHDEKVVCGRVGGFWIYTWNWGAADAPVTADVALIAERIVHRR